MAAIFGMTLLWMPALRHIPIASGLPRVWWLAVIAIAAQALFGGSLILAQAVQAKTSRFQKLVIYLPISTFNRWFLLNSSAFLIYALLTSALILPGVLLFGKSGVGMLGAMAFVAGVASGFGLSNIWPMHPFAGWAFAGGLVAAEYFSIKHVTSFYLSGQTPPSWWFILLVAILLIPICLAIYSAINLPGQIQQSQKKSALMFASPGIWAWHITKVLRNRKIWLSLAFALAIDVLLIFFVHGRVDTNLALFTSAVFASSITTEIRSLAKLSSPAEITALSGTRSFMIHQVISALILAFICTLPLGIAVGLGYEYFALIIFSAAVGLTISELLASSMGSVMGQVFAAFLCLSFLIGLPKLLPVRELDSLVRLSLAGVLIGGCFAIERWRNNFSWRKHA